MKGTANATAVVRWPLKDGSVVLLDVDVYPHLARSCGLYRTSEGSRRVILYERGKGWGKAAVAPLDRILMRAKPGQWVVHLNGDVADCRRCNMRLTRDRQVAGNRRKALEGERELRESGHLSCRRSSPDCAM